jgi:hypothetical protein
LRERVRERGFIRERIEVRGNGRGKFYYRGRIARPVEKNRKKGKAV